MGQIKLSPSKARIINMPLPILVGHYHLVKAKVSTLSSTQRQRVLNRVQFHLDKGNITQEELDSKPIIKTT